MIFHIRGKINDINMLNHIIASYVHNGKSRTLELGQILICGSAIEVAI